MGDTRAINIIIAGMIIFIVIAGFYMFLTKQTIEKQNNAIRGTADTLKANRLVSEWAVQHPSELHATSAILEKSLTELFEQDPEIKKYDERHQLKFISCTGGRNNVECHVVPATIGPHGYKQIILVPEEDRVRKITVEDYHE